MENIGLLPLVLPLPAQAGGVVTTYSDDTDLSAKLAGGGLVTFTCGPNPATAVLASTKTVAQDTTIEGGGGAARLFVVNAGATLTLSNITIAGGYANGGARRDCTCR